MKKKRTPRKKNVRISRKAESRSGKGFSLVGSLDIHELWDAQTTGKKVALLSLFFFYILYVAWGLLNEGTWDEDCPARYFNALNALSHPREFISSWNRPLWILLFALPAHLGKFTVPVIMSLISCLGAYFLYRGERERGAPHAALVIPLLLMQPYFLGVGRDAMTEPLGACIIAAGYFFLQKNQMRNFALVGALLPLARVELSVLLSVWAILLLIRKSWKFIPLLGLGLVAWHLAGYLIEGDPMFLYNEIVKGGADNRYGHQPFNTYFSRYFYVIGPVVFLFFFNGLLDRVLRGKVDLFVVGQFILGFCLYTVFAWKLDVGQSAGFLRNLIPLSPFVALIALTGLNRYIGAVGGLRKHWIALAGALIVLLLTAFFFRTKIVMHHIIKEEFDPFNLPVVAALFFLLLLMRGLVKAKVFSEGTAVKSLIAGVMVLLIGHTLITEPPDANMNAERRLMSRLAHMHKQTGLNKAPQTLCNYNWFHWVAGYDPNSTRYPHLTQENLTKAPPESIIVWEPHFGNRLIGDVPLQTIQGNDEYDQLALFTAEDFSRNMFVFRKRVPSENREATLNKWTEIAKNWPEAQISRGNQLMNRGDLNGARGHLNQAIAVDSTNVVALNMLSQVYLKMQDLDQSEVYVRRALRHGENYPVNYHILGNILYNRGKYQEALESYTDAIELNEGIASFYFNRGLAYAQLNQKSAACEDFKKSQSLGNANAQSQVQTYCN